MGIASRRGPLRVVALLSGIVLVAGCTDGALKSPPAPISGSPDIPVSGSPAPAAVAQSYNRAAVHRPRHASIVVAAKPKRHARVDRKSQARAKTVKRAPHHNSTEPETAANAGAVHHIGPKVIPLD
jgi:hypothetical protein